VLVTAAVAAFVTAVVLDRRLPEPAAGIAAAPVGAGGVPADAAGAPADGIAPVMALRDAATTPAAPADAGPPPDAAVILDASTEPPKRIETGALAIYASPWALVWIDGVPRGETPVRARLPAGVHRVRLKNDTRDKTVTVTVTTAKETVIDESW
jgi:hypothetical protein